MKRFLNSLQFLVLIIVFSGISACDFFAAGSYPYAEQYEVKANEVALIKAIENFKKDNPQYNVPQGTLLQDGKRNPKDLWYDVYFYYPAEKQIIHTWTRSSFEKGVTDFAFVGINQGLVLGNWKRINKDYSYFENKEQKQKFENQILNKIR